MTKQQVMDDKIRFLGERVAELDRVQDGWAKSNEKLLGLIAERDSRIAELEAALNEREADMHVRIRQGYDKTIADCWRAKVAELEADKSDLTKSRSQAWQERDEAHAALREIAETVGAHVSPECTQEFHCLVAKEVRLVFAKIKLDLTNCCNMWLRDLDKIGQAANIVDAAEQIAAADERGDLQSDIGVWHWVAVMKKRLDAYRGGPT